MASALIRSLSFPLTYVPHDRCSTLLLCKTQIFSARIHLQKMYPLQALHRLTIPHLWLVYASYRYISFPLSLHDSSTEPPITKIVVTSYKRSAKKPTNAIIRSWMIFLPVSKNTNSHKRNWLLVIQKAIRSCRKSSISALP